MPRRKKANKRTKGKTITLARAQDYVEITLDGKQRLNLSFKEIIAVPKSIQKLCEVNELDLSRNLIRKIPDFIKYFVSITILDLHSNYLEELPASIGRLQNLEILNLCNNRLTSLPDEIGLLSKLHTLNLGLNQLYSLPSSIGMLKDLRYLGLSDNQFTRVPRCLARLKNLDVNLDRNPLLTPQIPIEKSLMVTEGFYLVKGSFLCDNCLNKCRAQKMTMMEEVEAAQKERIHRRTGRFRS